jgi:hypothetical protein
MKDYANLHEILQKAVVALHNSKIDEAISLLSVFREKIIEQISHMEAKSAYDYLQNIAYLTYVTMLHYLALALKESGKQDSVERLVCLSESFGINNVIECVLFPLLMADPAKAKEFAETVKPIEGYRQNLGQQIRKLVRDIKVDPTEEKKKLNQSIKKIIDSVNPSSMEVRNLAMRLTSKYEAGDFKQARKLYEFVRDEIRYIRDPLLFEDVQPPEVTLKRLSGDCDDQAVLLCSLLLAIGFETALIFADTDDDGYADHVYCAVHIPNAPDVYKPFNRKINGIDLHDWIPLDPTSEDLEFGLMSVDNLAITDVFFFTKDKQYIVGKSKSDMV